MNKLIPIVLALLVSAVAAVWSLNQSETTHLLQRTGFGLPSSEVQQFSILDRKQSVDALLGNIRSVPQVSLPKWANEPIPRPPRAAKGEDPNKIMAERKAFWANERDRGRELQAWWISQMIATNSPLEERMVLFWQNHFTSSLQKVRYPELMLKQDLLIRKYALGNYADFLHAIAKDPAMILYLDNETNRKGRANENFAREVMELFTLGVGHYTENDVKAAARAFTGWRVNHRTGKFFFAKGEHDNTQKTFLGETGNWNGDDIINIILKQKQASIFITRELWQTFISPTPDPTVVARIAEDFRSHNYNLKRLVGNLLRTDAFWAPDNRNSLVKSPVELMIGMIRTLGMTPAASPKVDMKIAGEARVLDQNLFDPLSVKGWSHDTGWIHSDTLLGRERAILWLLRAYARVHHISMGSPKMVHLRRVCMAPAYQLD